MAAYTDYPRGSEWRKWDLQVQTRLDNGYTCLGNSLDDGKLNILIEKTGLSKAEITAQEKSIHAEKYAKLFVSHITNFTDITTIGITDHNTGKELDFLIKESQQTSGKLTIIPGVEISSSHGIHILCLFDPEKPWKENWANSIDHFLTEIGLTCTAFNSSGQPKNSTKTSQEILEIVAEKDGVCIFAHIATENGLFYRQSSTANGGTAHKDIYIHPLCQIVQIPHSGNVDAGTQNIIDGRDANYENKSVTKIKCSDARKLTDIGSQFVWIKADPTFEGLKQIIYEPQSRVRLQPEKPEGKIPYTVIDSVRFLDKKSTPDFSQDWIPLNQNLNSIIGGKSSGKSLLLYHIAKTIDSDRIDSINAEKGTHGKVEYSLENEPNFNFEVKWADGETYKLKDREKPNRPITYIPQLYLNRLAEEQKNQLNILVENMLMESFPEYKDFRNISKARLDKIKTEMFQVIDEYYKIKDALVTKKKELKEIGDPKAISDNQKQIQERIEELRKESSFTEEEEKKYSELTQKISALKTQHADKKSFVEILETAKESYAAFNASLEKTLADTVSSAINTRFPVVPENISKKVSDIITNTAASLRKTMEAEIEKSFADIPEERKRLTEIESGISQAAKELEPFEKKVKNSNVFAQSQKELETETSKLKAINEKQSEIDKLTQALSTTKIKDKYKELFLNHKNVIIENQKYGTIPDSNNNLKLTSSVKIKDADFQENFTRKINKKKSLDQQFGTFYNSENEYMYNENDHLTYTNTMIDKVASGEVSLNTGYDEKHALLSLLDDYFFIDYNLLQDGDDLIKMSPGKRGIILFQIFLHLSKSENPILIDQPEDNLDNRTVYQELNEFIKTKKTTRQIITVSHNPNLVVSTDSENIIVANQAGQQKAGENSQYKFEYVNGALEHSFVDESKTGILFKKGIRQHVCDVLEGGEEAFAKREDKYGLKTRK